MKTIMIYKINNTERVKENRNALDTENVEITEFNKHQKHN